MSPVKTTEWKCFAENWTSITIPEEIDRNPKSIYPAQKIIISLDRG